MEYDIVQLYGISIDNVRSNPSPQSNLSEKIVKFILSNRTNKRLVYWHLFFVEYNRPSLDQEKGFALPGSPSTNSGKFVSMHLDGFLIYQSIRSKQQVIAYHPTNHRIIN